MINKSKSFTRRQFTKSGFVLGAAAMGTGKVVNAQSPANELESTYLMELVLDTGESMDAGHTQVAAVTGGTFSGPRLKGIVLPGADWITQVSGHSALDVRITLQTDDGATIYMTYNGIVYRGDGNLYWRVTPLFNTASAQYEWLNHIIAVGRNKQIAGKVAYDIFEIL